LSGADVEDSRGTLSAHGGVKDIVSSDDVDLVGLGWLALSCVHRRDSSQMVNLVRVQLLYDRPDAVSITDIHHMVVDPGFARSRLRRCEDRDLARLSFEESDEV